MTDKTAGTVVKESNQHYLSLVPDTGQSYEFSLREISHRAQNKNQFLVKVRLSGLVTVKVASNLTRIYFLLRDL